MSELKQIIPFAFSLDKIDAFFQQDQRVNDESDLESNTFLAKNRSSGDAVLLKIIHDINDADTQQHFKSEIDVLRRLQGNDAEDVSRGQAGIVRLLHAVISPCDRILRGIVLEHGMGSGTLRDEIVSRSNDLVHGKYTERRIAWYALQLCDALSFCHSRGVAHSNVKSQNVQVNRTKGGKLVLTNFGSKGGTRTTNQSEISSDVYKPPEQVAFSNTSSNHQEIDKCKADSYGLGCILFELLSCQALDVLLKDPLVGESIMMKKNWLGLPCVRLPWLSSTEANILSITGYSLALKSLVESFLESIPSQRCLPIDWVDLLRQDPQSPLLVDRVVASEPLVPGSPVTIDNIQLGMFVQRGLSWHRGDQDGGPGTVGLVTGLCKNAGVCKVAWPVAGQNRMRCRIGLRGCFDLQVGPPTFPDFVVSLTSIFSSTPAPKAMRTTGVVDNLQVRLGQMIDGLWMVVDDLPEQGRAFVAPKERVTIESLALNPICSSSVNEMKVYSRPHRTGNPWSWDDTSRVIVPVTSARECELVAENFSIAEEHFEIVEAHRIQCPKLWDLYTDCRDVIESENWGIANEFAFFQGTGSIPPQTLADNPGESTVTKIFSEAKTRDNFLVILSGSRFEWIDTHAHVLSSGLRQVVLLNVALGRTLTHEAKSYNLPYHSESVACIPTSTETWAIRNPFQIYPVYIVTYKPKKCHGMTPRGCNSTPRLPKL